MESELNDCWIYAGLIDSSTGYGKIFDKGAWAKGKKSMQYVHRAMYEHAYGEVPVGLELDHLCHNRACVNPDHLEAVTHKENLMRGNCPTAINARKTHCSNGHEYSGTNLIRTRRGRKCRTCRDAWNRARVRRTIWRIN